MNDINDKLAIKNEDWRNTLLLTYQYCEQKFSNVLEYSTRSLENDHGCPPPIPELNGNEGLETDTMWNGKRVLWCYPANPKQGELLKKNEKIPVACLGTAFWAIIHTLKILGYESKIDVDKIQTLKRVSLKHKNGLPQAFVDLGWAKEIFTDPEKTQGGDVGIIGYGEQLPHHWFIVAENPHIVTKDEKSVNTWAASPAANGAGYDYWFKEKTNSKGESRYWKFARPFEA